MVTFAPPDKRRPALVLSRQIVLPRLFEVNVAEITSTIRGLPTEVILDVEDGMKHPCCVNLHQVHSVRRTLLRTYVATLSPTRMRQICRALNMAMGCMEPG